MKKIFFKWIFGSVSILLFMGLCGYVFVGYAQSSPSLRDMISGAGFTQVVEQAQINTRFSPPVKYFRVGESVRQGDWGDGGTLVAVLITPKPKDFVFNNGQMEVRMIVGKTQARFTTEKNYIVVTGPDREKVINLAYRLKDSF